MNDKFKQKCEDYFRQNLSIKIKRFRTQLRHKKIKYFYQNKRFDKKYLGKSFKSWAKHLRKQQQRV
jgi:hypothetical protein